MKRELCSGCGAGASDRHVPPPDAIQEFKVQTNAMSAEYGLEPAKGIEPPTYGLRNRCSTD